MSMHHPSISLDNNLIGITHLNFTATGKYQQCHSSQEPQSSRRMWDSATLAGIVAAAAHFLTTAMGLGTVTTAATVVGPTVTAATMVGGLTATAVEDGEVRAPMEVPTTAFPTPTADGAITVPVVKQKHRVPLVVPSSWEWVWAI